MSVSVKRILAAAVCMCLLLTTACGSGGTEKGKAMGRYVEQLLEFPIENANVWSMLQRSDGSMDAYISGGGTGKLQLYNTQDGEKWAEKEFSINLPEKEEYQEIFYDEKGRVYLNVRDYNGSSIVTKVYLMGADGALQPKEIHYKDENGADAPDTMIENFQILKNGDFVGVQRGRVVQYSASGEFKRFYGGKSASYGAQYATYENTICILDQESGTVSRYDAESGKSAAEVPFDSMTDQTSIAGTKSGTVYLYNTKGIFRLAKGGTMWEKIIDGDLTSLSIPSLYFFNFAEGSDGSIYLTCGNETKTQLAKYTYDKTIASLPEKELVVYTLTDNKMLRQATGEFQRSHPDTKVNIQVAMGEDSAATKSDLIRTLNAELLNKKGPDVLLLDGMPIDNYIEKGVLADLSGVLKDLDADKTMNKAVVNTYKNKDGVYAIPTKFAMPLILTDDAKLANMKDLKSAAQFAKENQDLPLIGDKSPANLMNLFLPSCAPAWIKDGKIDEKGLGEFLQNIKTIADSGSQSYELEPEDTKVGYNVSTGGELGPGAIASLDTSESKLKRSGDLFCWAYGRSHAAPLSMTGYNSLIDVSVAQLKKGEGKIASMPGQVKNVFLPMSVIGVNGNSGQQDSAKDFVALMLSDSVQNAKLYDGFAVNRGALKKQADDVAENASMSTSSPFDENEELSGDLPNAEEQKVLLKLCEAVKTPFDTDSTLTGMITDEAKGYFTGEKDLKTTMADIKEATKLYLSE